MSLRELLQAYDDEQRALSAQQSLSTSPASSSSSSSSLAASTSSLTTSPTSCCSIEPPAAKREHQVFGSMLATDVVVQLALPEHGSATATLRQTLTASLPPLRKHEHLAVLLPKANWKRSTATCDAWDCNTQFSLFDRRHHCRKCGGIFCPTHASRTTALIDMTRAGLAHPPRGKHILLLHSPRTPVTMDARVCDDCHDLIHGVLPTYSEEPESIVPPVVVVVESSSSSSRRQRRKSTKSSTMSAPPSSSGSHLSHGSAASPPLASTPPPPLLCDEDGNPLPPALATLRVLRLGRDRCHSPEARWEDAAAAFPVYPSLQQPGAEPVPSPVQPVRPDPTQLLTAYPLHERSDICKRRASERRRTAHEREVARQLLARVA